MRPSGCNTFCGTLSHKIEWTYACGCIVEYDLCSHAYVRSRQSVTAGGCPITHLPNNPPMRPTGPFKAVRYWEEVPDMSKERVYRNGEMRQPTKWVIKPQYCDGGWRELKERYTAPISPA